MKKTLSLISGTLLVSMLILTGVGCGAKGMAKPAAIASDSASQYATNDIYDSGGMEAAAVEMNEESVEPADTAGGADTPEVSADTSRKLIKNVDLEVETEQYDDLITTVKNKTESLGGYIENFSAYNGSNYYDSRQRNANLTIRIPSEKLDGFVEAVAQESNIINRTENVRDITLQYVDMDSHKKALMVEQESLLSLLEKAETVEDIITLQSRLTDVRYQIESMESQLRTFDNQVAYSTVMLYISEVAKLTPVKEQSAWEKISTGFAESLHNVGKGVADFLIGTIIRIPYLIVWAIVIALIVIVIGLISRFVKKRKARSKFQAMSSNQKEVIFKEEKTPQNKDATEEKK